MYEKGEINVKKEGKKRGRGNGKRELILFEELGENERRGGSKVRAWFFKFASDLTAEINILDRFYELRDQDA